MSYLANLPASATYLYKYARVTDLIQLPYNTYQTIRQILNLPDVVCGE